MSLIEDQKHISCAEDIVENNQILPFESKIFSPLRYAATGFYSVANAEVAIATDNVRGALQRLQGPEVVIA